MENLALTIKNYKFVISIFPKLSKLFGCVSCRWTKKKKKKKKSATFKLKAKLLAKYS